MGNRTGSMSAMEFYWWLPAICDLGAYTRRMNQIARQIAVARTLQAGARSRSLYLAWPVTADYHRDHRVREP